MEQWIFYAGVAALLIAMRDIFTKKFSTKYSPIEHLLYYYVLCSVFIILYCTYQSVYLKRDVKMIDTKDIWKYVLVTGITVAVIAPCEVLSLKYCKTAGQSKSIINLNTLFVFVLGIIFFNDKFSMRKLLGIMLTILGIYLVM